MTTTEELDRRQTNTGKILYYFKRNGEATNHQLMRIGGYRFGARLLELKQEGHRIVKRHIKGSTWLYTYKGHPDDDNDQVSLFTEGL